MSDGNGGNCSKFGNVFFISYRSYRIGPSSSPASGTTLIFSIISQLELPDTTKLVQLQILEIMASTNFECSVSRSNCLPCGTMVSKHLACLAEWF